ncbi:MAG: diguanylate cyclase, partial [Pseudoflavonifractor sp.]
YERRFSRASIGTPMFADRQHDHYHFDDLFAFNEEVKSLFGNLLQAAVIYEFSHDQIAMIRVNEAYYALLGHDDMLAKAHDTLSLTVDEYRDSLLEAFRTCARTQGVSECDYLRHRTSGGPIWIHTKLQYASTVGNRHIIIGELTDITLRRALDSEFQKYRATWLSDHHSTRTVLIVDDAAINRTVLKNILQNEFLFLEAENGAEAVRLLQDKENQVDLILLDISMPVMDGTEFLKYKKNTLALDGIPVIMITADDSPEQQTNAFSLGANDYIVKPFIPAVVTRRVNNVLEANHQFKKMVKEYNTMSVRVKTDLMTGLINRVSAEEMIAQRLENAVGTCVMMMLDIDHFKQINDSRGHEYGDKVICAVARQLCLHFRKEDVIARMGGDEFAAFVGDIPDGTLVQKKAQRLCKSVLNIEIDGRRTEITCSIGIALSNQTTRSFQALYQNSDKALYSAKCRGGNTVVVYGEEPAEIV